MKFSRILLYILFTGFLFVMISPANAAITNGSFEDDFTGWNAVNVSGTWTIDEYWSHAGSNSAMSSGSFPSAPDMLYQIVANPDYDALGTSMAVSFSAYADLCDANVQLFIWYSNADQAPEWDADGQWTAAPGSESGMVAEVWDGWDDNNPWDYISYSDTWDFEAKWFKIGVGLGSNNAIAWVDSVTFSPSASVPVPSGIFLMISGLICLVRIRRKG